MFRKLFLLLVLASVIPGVASAYTAGRTTSASNSCGCHGALTPGLVSVTGLAAIMAGTSSTYTASMVPGNTGAAITVALAAPLVGATLGDLEANTKMMAKTGVPDQVVQTDGADVVGDWSYNFLVNAPLTLGTILVNVAMLAIDGDGSDAGDYYSNLQFSIQVVPEPSTILLCGLGLAGLAALGRRK